MDLGKANAKLDRVKLRQKGSKIYIRGTFPPKPGDMRPKQYDVATGLSASSEGIRIAYAKAQKLEADLNLERFDWKDWISGGGRVSDTVEEWVNAFTKDYWGRKQQTVNRLHNFQLDYGKPFNYLPQDATLTPELLKKALLSFPPESRDRRQTYTAYNALAKFAGLECDLSPFKGEYKVQIKRTLPTDTQIEEVWRSIYGEAWRWVFGMFATFGLRPHEIFHLDCSRLSEEVPILKVGENTKTGARIVFPMPLKWVEKFSLTKVVFPGLSTEGKSNRELGTKIGAGLRQQKLKINGENLTVYHLRDAYAVRCAVRGVEVSRAAKWMGHSISVHEKAYLSHIGEVSEVEAWLRSQG